MTQVYIQGFGAFFPGDPVSNEEMEEFLGRIHGRPSRARLRVLKQNGIQARHYAIDRQQRSRYRNSEMAALAVHDALARTGLPPGDVDFLAAGTTQPDLLVPGFASMVHGELGLPPLEIATLQGVCGSGMAALQAAFLQVKAGDKRAAVACASEFPSRLFKASRYERRASCGARGLPFDTEFLRWMLSDGAGAALLAPTPAPGRLSLRIDWIEVRSHAGERPVCMLAGANLAENGEPGPSWLDYPSSEDAASAGALDLKQDVRLLDDVVRLGVQRFGELVLDGRVDPAGVDWLVCHYSSEFFRSRIAEALAQAGLEIPQERWFSNLTTRGNVGSASAFVLLEELMRTKLLQPGQRILLMVPESGRSLAAFAHLSVVGPACERTPLDAAGADALPSRLVRELAQVWSRFERELRGVPIVSRLLSSRFTLDDYRKLLFHLRQQVVDGSRWIARAASSLDGRALELRSLVLGHAREEHRDYELLEQDYAAVGGDLAEIRGGEKNAGSEALSAWMFHEASQPNPLGLLGAMFVIEGLGKVLAGPWAEKIQAQLGLADEQLRFLRYHGVRDAGHLEKLQGILGSDLVDEGVARRIVRTARITARLYRLQLEEIG